MKHKPTSEMEKLLWPFTIPILLLVTLIVIAYLVYGILNAEHHGARSSERDVRG